MTIQYVMKATHINSAPFGTVYWVVSGAADMTGAQSGYSMSDLTSIAVDYITTVSVSTTGSAGTTLLIPQRYTPIDSATLIYWKFDETASPYLNSGSGIALPITIFSGSTTTVAGLFGEAVGFSSLILSTGNSSLNETTGPAITVSVWIYLRNYTSSGTIFTKAYRSNNTWANPYTSLDINLTPSNDGTWQTAIAVGGTLYQPTISGPFTIPLTQWVLLAFTHDGNNLRTYMNGALANTTSAIGTIDYGTHGPWDIGGVSNAGTGQQIAGQIDDFRLENTVRSQSYIEAMYKNGTGKYDGSFGNPTQSVYSDGYVNLPPAGVTGRLFLPTDNSFAILRDNGKSWIPYVPAGPNFFFTSKPPVASNWIPAAYSTLDPCTDVAEGVSFNQTNGKFGTFFKTLASPGGAHVVTMFLRSQVRTTNNTVEPNIGIAIGGTTTRVLAAVTNNYQGAGNGVLRRALQARNFTTNGFVANLNGGTGTAETDPHPYGDAWWRITFDNTNVTVERCSIGGDYYVFAGPVAHGIGAIQKVGIEISTDGSNLGCTLLDYVET